MAKQARINPQISIVEVGIKTLREITIYPLSVNAQFQMTELITSVVQSFAENQTLEKEQDDVVVVKMVVEAVQQNLEKFFDFVLDKDESIDFDELTNNQLMDIVDVIFENNYEHIIKNLKSLLGRAKTLWTSKESLPKSSGKPATD